MYAGRTCVIFVEADIVQNFFLYAQLIHEQKSVLTYLYWQNFMRVYSFMRIIGHV